ncbi:type II toxin-antitoxin system VapC family toxin [Brevundimonas sp.]|uniref:type II toxin-antitoxin system VapC family toxin n=1 Tax=Brevundimonas sp. TaxID=1871086 RepID=UPI002ABBE1DD|nr:type II toxin-antitoxin system VapC family toxin [Brevundimonas sp.]MDZ4363232.1 type II toxin-antitoxin system VapC family toxin [Brevundimonas sp.]
MLDTHVLVWALTVDGRLSKTARAAIQSADIVHVSAASLYEIEAKRRRNRLRGRSDELDHLPVDLLNALTRLGFSILGIEPDHAILAGRLDILHSDPWDRILVAQARDLMVPLISADTALREQAGDTPVIW